MSKFLHQISDTCQSLHAHLDPNAAQAAALLVAGRRIFGRYGVTHSVDMDPFISMLHDCVQTWCEAHEVAEKDVDRALVVLNDKALRLDMSTDYATLLS